MRPALALALVLGSIGLTCPALAQPYGPALGAPDNQEYPAPIDQQYSNNQGPDNESSPDMYCRRQAAQESGYNAPKGASASSDGQQRYSDDYYACMGEADNVAPNQYAYGPPPPPPPYYYRPYGYPYAYYPPYYGPGISFGFGFGGRGWHR